MRLSSDQSQGCRRLFEVVLQILKNNHGNEINVQIKYFTELLQLYMYPSLYAYMKSLQKCKNQYINFYQFEIFAIKAAEKQRK